MFRGSSVRTNNNQNETVSSFGTGAVVPAFFAALVVQFFRVDQHRNLMLMWSEFTFFALLSMGLSLVARKWLSAASKNRNQIHAICVSQLGSAMIIVLLLCWQFVVRAYGFGDPNEIVALLILQYLAFYLAMVGFVPGCDRTSLVLSGALVFFVCCMTERFEIFCLAGIFMVIGLWGLLGLYWNRLDAKAIDGSSKMLTVHSSSIGVASLVILLAIGAAMLAPLSDGATSLRGFMPFSGGEDGYEDEFALDGVGDGEMLTGGDNATTTGAVDTDQFIEDHNPSLYDVMSDKFDGPVTKRKRLNRAVSLDAVSKHIHELKQSEMAGKTFRTMRESGDPADKVFENKVTDSLFFVEGSVPARFSITSYQHFDGWDWTSVDTKDSRPKTPKIKLRKRDSKPVFSLGRKRRDYLPGTRVHRVKMMRLKTRNLPAPAYLNSWHIANVDEVDFFDWSDQGQIRFDGDSIPSQTVIDLNSFVPNYHLMRTSKDLKVLTQNTRQPFADSNEEESKAVSPYLQIPTKHAGSNLESFINTWTNGIAPGWNQVESIVGHVRNDFELNPDWRIDQDADDTVEHFLDQLGGPSYMFATTCAIALRSAGYKTRLASGFIVEKSDYDSFAKQSAVDGDNVHMWPEVCLDGTNWIPVEPTPGYSQPYSIETTWQKFVATIFACFRWIYQNPITFLMTISALVFAVLNRVRFITAGWFAWWYLVRLVWPAGLLSATRQLIDARFWAAGVARPASHTISDWYSQVEPSLPSKFYDLWNARNYSDSRQAIDKDILILSCSEQVQMLTSQKIKSYFCKHRNGENQ